MHLRPANHRRPWLLVLVTLAATGAFTAAGAGTNQIVSIRAAGFTLGREISAADATNRFQFALKNSGAIPFAQSVVKQSTEAARFGPDAKKPYFTVRFAMPIPPSNATNEVGALAGLDPMVFSPKRSFRLRQKWIF